MRGVKTSCGRFSQAKATAQHPMKMAAPTIERNFWLLLLNTYSTVSAVLSSGTSRAPTTDLRRSVTVCAIETD